MTKIMICPECSTPSKKKLYLKSVTGRTGCKVCDRRRRDDEYQLCICRICKDPEKEWIRCPLKAIWEKCYKSEPSNSVEIKKEEKLLTE